MLLRCGSGAFFSTDNFNSSSVVLNAMLSILSIVLASKVAALSFKYLAEPR
jgi:hypothetical protein